MGLDMYLERVEYKDETKKITEAMYWRKAYLIMDWFETNTHNENGIDNCARYTISRGQLEKLKKFCEATLEKELTQENLTEALTLTWFTPGQWDEYEKDQLKSTIDFINKELEETDENIYYYFLGWW